MNLIPSEQRDRHAYIDTKIANAHTLATRYEPVTAALGEEFVDQFNEFAQNYYVPDVRDGLVVLTEAQQQSAGFPVIAAELDEDVYLGADFVSFTPEQEDAIGVVFADYEMDDFAQGVIKFWKAHKLEQIADTPTKFNLDALSAQAMVAGQTLTSNLEVLDMPRFVVTMRGLLVLGLPEEDGSGVNETAVFHEDVHRLQNRSQPIGPYVEISDYYLERELPAYERAADALVAMKEAGVNLHTAGELFLGAPEIIRDILYSDMQGRDRWSEFLARMDARRDELKAR